MTIPTIRCSKCNWEYPITTDLRHCRFCRTTLPNCICRNCGIIVDEKHVNYRGYCVTCYIAKYKPNGKADVRFKELSPLITAMPKNILTELQWLETIAFFNGCAFCESNEVITRQYIVPPLNGGAYIKSNVIPLCEECTTKYRKGTARNIFITFNKSLDNVIKFILEEVNNG